MIITAKTFDELNKRELYEILKIRAAVFVVEQECAYQDIDGCDMAALHLMMSDGDEIKAYLRIFVNEQGRVQIGRMLSVERRKGYARELLNEGINRAVSHFGAKKIYLEAQSYAKELYRRAGFVEISDEFDLDGIPHVEMMLEL